jgi:RNA-directed DNA polymerase
MENIPIDKEILRKFLKSGFIEYGKYNPVRRGIAQGDCLAPAICNMVLDGLEDVLNSSCSEKVHFTRYADDFIVIGESKDYLLYDVKPIISSFLAERGLSLSAEKTKITHINEGFDFLGWNVSKNENMQVLIEPSMRNLNSILDKINDVIQRDVYMTRERRFDILKPIIVGWRNYHTGVITEYSLNRAEKDILSCIWKITQDRHLIGFIAELFR